MKCLNCLNVYKGKQKVNLPHLLSHLEKWGMCKECSDDVDTLAADKASDYYHKNKEHYKELHKGYKSNLTDSYVANIVADGTSLKAKDIPKQLVQGKRQQMQVKRIVKEQE